MKKILILLLLGTLFTATPGSAREKSAVNFKHLESLKFTFKVDGKQYTSWAIYAEPVKKGKIDGPYRQAGAPGEGFGCVDDVARIGLLYLQHFEKTKDPRFLEPAEKALEFLLYMEDGRGGFYNFVDEGGKINKTGHTSRTSLDWWTARAFWAIGRGIRVIGDRNSDLTSRLKKCYARILSRIYRYRQNPAISKKIIDRYRLLEIEPGTLINDSGAITSIYVLGLLEYYRANENREDPLKLRVRSLIGDFCRSILKMEETSTYKYPLTGFHYPSLWDMQTVHLYGNRQVKSLALAGKYLGKQEWIESACREADRAYPLLLCNWHLPFALSPQPEIYPQIAYSAETVISNLIAIYQATGRKRYLILAQLFGSWFFGNNPAEERIYFPKTGRCLDGIDISGININSGAESTLEALWALSLLESFSDGEYIRVVSNLFPRPDPLFVPVEDMNTEGDVNWRQRNYTGGATRKIALLSSGGRLSFSREFDWTGTCRAHLVFRKNDPKPGVIKVKIAGRQRAVTVQNSPFGEGFKTVFLEKFRVNPGDNVCFTILNDKSGQEIYIDSVMLQKQIQQCNFEGDFGNLILRLNSFPTPTTIPVDFSPLLGSAKDCFFSDREVLMITLKPLSWIMIKK